MSDNNEVVIPVPSGYSEEEAAAFRAGFRTCAQINVQANGTYVEAAVDRADDSDEEPTECPDCGAPLLASMGADETSTPAGKICPECEL